jgi:phage terminase large subunit-like protein
MAACGQIMDPWQRDSMDVMLGVRPDGKWACLEYAEWVARQNGKGAIGEARVFAGLFLLGERLIMWSAHEYKTAMEAYVRIKDLLGALGERVSDTLYDVSGIRVKVSNTNGEESLTRLDTGQRVKFVARSKGSGRGFSADVNIIDEAFAYTNVMQEALLPTLSARPNPQIVYLSSPPLTGDTGEVMYRLRKRAEAGGDDSLGYRDWGLAGTLENLAGIDTADQALWLATNPSMSGARRLPSLEYVAKEQRSMSREGFARERLGVWPAEITGGNGRISLDLWEALSDPGSRRAGDVAIAYDVTPERDRAAIAVAGPRADGLMHWEVIDQRPGVDWLVPRLVGLKKSVDPVAICADGKGPGASLLGDLERAGIRKPENEDRPARGDLIVMASQDVANAFGAFVDACNQKRGRHIGQAQLTAALAGAKTRPLGDGGEAWGRRTSGEDISSLVAVTAADWAYHTRIDKLSTEAFNIW